MHAQIAGITPKLRNLAEPGRPRSRPPGQFSRCSLEALFKLVAQLPQAGERAANAGHGRPFALQQSMVHCNIDAEAHKSRDSNETNPFELPAAPGSLDFHEFTVPHSAGYCAIPSPA